MPFSGTIFTLPTGATNAVAGNTVQSATWNSIHSDINSGFTQVMQQLVSMSTGRNLLSDNGSFEIWQRGAGGSAVISVAASTLAYTADRWYLQTGANQAFTVTQSTSLTNPSTFSALVQRTAGQTGTTLVVFAHPFDTQELAIAHGNKVSLSFVVQPGANWSPASGTFNYALYCGTGAVAKRNATPYTNETTPITGSVNIAAGGGITSVAVTSSVVIPTTTTQMELQFNWTPVGTAGATDAFSIDDVQIEVDFSVGTWTPTTYDRVPFTWRLDSCKRHYQKTFPYTVAPAQTGGLLGSLVATSQGNIKFGYQWQFPTEMRATPGVTTFNPLGASANWQDISAAASLVATVDTTSVSNSTKTLYISGATAAATDHQICIHVTASAGI